MVDVVAAVGTADGEVVGVNATSICTREVPARCDTVKIHGMVLTAEAGIMEDITSHRATTPRPKSIATRTEGTHRKAIIHITNKAGTGAHINRSMIHGLRINNPPTEVVEEDIIPITTARMVGRMGIPEGEEVNLPIEGEVLRTVEEDTETKEVREEGIGTVAVRVADTINPRKTAVIAGAVPVGVAVITLEVINPVEVTTLVVFISPAEAISQVGVISPAEAISKVEVINQAGVISQAEVTSQAEVINQAEVTSPVADSTTPVSSLTGTEADIIRGVEVVGEDTDHAGA